MIKKAVIALCLVALIFCIFGCSSSNNNGITKTPASIEYIRDAKLANVWQMKQLQLNFTNDMSITVELAAGDKVDGYFYVISNAGIGFSISGISQVYASPSGAMSDRFSFTASQEQGIDYKLKFTIGSGEATVFLELIYPATGQVMVPIGTK